MLHQDNMLSVIDTNSKIVWVVVLVQFDFLFFFQRRQHRSCDFGSELSGWWETCRVSAKLLQTNHHHLRRGSTGRLGYPSIKVGSH